MSIRGALEICDNSIICTSRKTFLLLARFAIFIVFFWFGILKVFGLSPATPMVEALHGSSIISFWPIDSFMMFFGVFEVIIGILFLLPHAFRIVFILLFFHMITTTMPLVMLPEYVWSGFLIPTLEGQYIIKNITIIALAIGIASHLVPIGKKA